MLPEIEVCLVEYTEQEHNRKNNIDTGRYAKGDEGDGAMAAGILQNLPLPMSEALSLVPAGAAVGKGAKGKSGEAKELYYYLVTCKDNGCGIAPENIAGNLKIVQTRKVASPMPVNCSA